MRCVFIDRDGTMGGGYYVEYPQDYYEYDGTREAFRLLSENGFSPMIFTNQSCIARKKDGGYDFEKEFVSVGAADWFICPHDSGDNCDCRKPKTGLLIKAKEKYSLTLSECYVIGDRWTDMVSGGKAGCRLILVMTGRGVEALCSDRDKWREYSPDYVAKNLLDAARWLCGGNNEK